MATSKSEKAEKGTYTVLSPLNFNNEHFTVGDKVEMTAGQADALVADGTLVKAK